MGGGKGDQRERSSSSYVGSYRRRATISDCKAPTPTYTAMKRFRTHDKPQGRTRRAEGVRMGKD